MTRRALQPLDGADCRRLAAVLGDNAVNPIATHALLTAQCRAYVLGELPAFEAAVVAPDYCPDEPMAWGAPDSIWELVSQIAGWTAIEVPTPVAAALAERVRQHTGRETKLAGDLFFVGRDAPRPFEHPAVRLLTIQDLDLLRAAPAGWFGGDPDRPRKLLADGIVAAGVIDGRVVGMVEAFCRTPRYANLGAVVLPEFRRRGIATAAASIVARRVYDEGLTPVWSTGERNLASQGVARKLGFVEIPGDTYVVPV